MTNKSHSNLPNQSQAVVCYIFSRNKPPYMSQEETRSTSYHKDKSTTEPESPLQSIFR